MAKTMNHRLTALTPMPHQVADQHYRQTLSFTPAPPSATLTPLVVNAAPAALPLRHPPWEGCLSARRHQLSLAERFALSWRAAGYRQAREAAPGSFFRECSCARGSCSRRMKVVVKNITQKVFEIELEASSTVRDVKNRLNEQHAIGSPELLKLIFQGKVLGDDETLNGTVNYSEDKFMVVMVSKAKAPAAASSAASPAASAVSAPASEAAQPAPLASAPASAPAPVAAPAPEAAPAAPAVSSAVQLQIDQICDMGFDRAQVELCMRAAFNNADRAVEYCMSGIPANVRASMSQSMPQRAAVAPGQSQRGDFLPHFLVHASSVVCFNV
jgi:hypothetical protein